MLIEMIDKLHLKVELSNSDMQTLEINRASFISKTERAKNVLKLILKNAYEQTGFEIFNEKMLVEIFPTNGDGCLIMFTKSPERKKKFRVTSPRKSVVFELSEFNNLLDCAKLLVQSGILADNSLFNINKKYFLSVKPDFCNMKRIFLILSEFGAKKIDFPEEYFEEHAKCLIKNNALETLCLYSNC